MKDIPANETAIMWENRSRIAAIEGNISFIRDGIKDIKGSIDSISSLQNKHISDIAVMKDKQKTWNVGLVVGQVVTATLAAIKSTL